MAYIRKKMKIGGNFRKASIFTPDLFPKPTKENIEKYTKMSPKMWFKFILLMILFIQIVFSFYYLKVKINLLIFYYNLSSDRFPFY